MKISSGRAGVLRWQLRQKGETGAVGSAKERSSVVGNVAKGGNLMLEKTVHGQSEKYKRTSAVVKYSTPSRKQHP